MSWNWNGYGNTMPTATQPYGYPMANYGMQQQSMAQQQMCQQPQTNTNKIYVSGIEEVRQRQLPYGSDVIFLDNDKPILYQKIVDSKGQFEVKAFNITPYMPVENEKNTQPIYATVSDLEGLKAELEVIKSKLG